MQGELLVEQSGLQSLRQIYGDGNIRVRETEARITSLQHDLEKMTGSADPPTAQAVDGSDTKSKTDENGELYPPLRQLPRLAVSYADLYRRVRVQEAVFELLTQQYEIASIDEAKDVPAVKVIDPPGVPERKSVSTQQATVGASDRISFFYGNVGPDSDARALVERRSARSAEAAGGGDPASTAQASQGYL